MSTTRAIVQPLPRSFHYGWVHVSLAALAMVGTLPGRTQGLGLVTEPLLADFQLDRVSYANINLAATLIGSLFCLPCGRLVDRFGSRLVLTVVLALLGLTVVGMSVAISLIALTVGITLTRGFGQSALSVVSLALVGKSFSRGLDYAMGVYALLVGIGFIAAFPSTGSAVLAYGWRTPWGVIGAILVLLFAPLAWMFVRDHVATENDTAAGDGHAGLTLGETLRTPSFWLFSLASATFGLVYSGIALFNQNILEQLGFPATMYHTVLVVSTILGLAANFAGGYLASRWSIQRLMGIGMAVLGLSLFSLPLVRTEAQVIGYGVLMGMAGGIVTVVFFSVWRRVYGAEHLGRIQGFAQMMTVLASAVGPVLLAEALSRTGSYDSIFFGLAAIVALLGLGCWLTPLPRLMAQGVDHVVDANPVG